MGKKGSAKQPLQQQPASPQVAPTNGNGSAPPPPMGATSWLADLDEQQREEERRRQEERQKKADEAKAREEKDRLWREKKEREEKKETIKVSRENAKQDRELQQTKMKAKREGVLEAQEYDDGLWYVELDKGTWKQVECAFWCTLCEASLSDWTLGDHLSGARHKKKIGWLAPSPGQPPPPAGPPPGAAQQALPSNGPRQLAPLPDAGGYGWNGAAAGPLEVWQEFDEYGGRRCLACNKICDGNHEYTQQHEQRLQAYMQSLQPRDYSEPSQQWLAWVAHAEWGGEKWLKCLMCNKWVQDLDGQSTDGYAGAHGILSPNNQKDHRKKMENLDAYMMDPHYWGAILSERRKWHPPRAAQPQLQINQPQLQNNQPQLQVNQPPPQPQEEERPRPPLLPAGWYSQWSPDHGMYYYYTANPGDTTWTIPQKPAAPNSPPPPSPDVDDEPEVFV